MENAIKTSESSLLSGDTKELTIVGGHLGPYCWPKAIDMVANQELPVHKIITHKLPMEDYLKGIKMVLSGKDSVKIMLKPPSPLE